jgi:hypothetical protein
LTFVGTFHFKLWPVSTVAQQPELGNQRDEYGYDYSIKLRSEREMKVGAGNFVTRGILLLIFVTNRILLVSILSPTTIFQYFSCHFDEIKFICVSDNVI